MLKTHCKMTLLYNTIRESCLGFSPKTIFTFVFGMSCCVRYIIEHRKDSNRIIITYVEELCQEECQNKKVLFELAKNAYET